MGLFDQARSDLGREPVQVALGCLRTQTHAQDDAIGPSSRKLADPIRNLGGSSGNTGRAF